MSAIAYVPDLHHPDPSTLPDATAEGAGSGNSGDYSGGQPTFTPTVDQDYAIDTVTEQIWWWYNGAWHG